MHKKRLLVGLCSWNNPKLLKISIESISSNLNLEVDGIAVVLNESDLESISYLHNKKIPFVSIPENRGVLAIDYLIPFIQNSEYFLNTNDDMLFHSGFAEDLIGIIENYYPCSASCFLVENFHSGNGCVYTDSTLGSIYDPETNIRFLENVKNGKYIRENNITSYNHPICVRSSDYLKVGGYSGSWDMGFYNGYVRDDMFAVELYNLHQENFKFISSKKSVVYHESSATMRRLPPHIKNVSNDGNFRAKTGMNTHQFKSKINCFSVIN